MAIVDNSTLKRYFTSGARPSVEQFVDLIDTLAVQGGSSAFSEFVLSLSLSDGDYVQTINHNFSNKPVFTFAVIDDAVVLPGIDTMTADSFRVVFESDHSGSSLYVVGDLSVVNPNTGLTTVSMNYTTPASALTVTHNIGNSAYFAFARDTATKQVYIADIESADSNSCDVIFDSNISGNLYIMGTGAGTVSYNNDGTLLNGEKPTVDALTLGSSVALYESLNVVVSDFTVRVESQVGSVSGSTATISLGSDAPGFSNIMPPIDMDLLALNEVYLSSRITGKTTTHTSDIKAKVKVAADGPTSQQVEFVLFGYEG